MAMRTDQTDNRPIRSLLRYMIKAPAVWSLAWPLLLLFGSYLAFNRFYAEHFAVQFESIDPNAVTISEPHEFVRTDLVSEVYRTACLHQLSPLDAHASAKLADAFSSHPWVRDVRSVRKLPGGGIDVQLEYREPVVLFHTTEVETKWDDQYFPLDGEGVMLPTDQMTLDDAPNFIHIEVGGLYPRGDEGTPFGDRRVEHAALLARLLDAIKDQVPVAKILVGGDPRMNLVPKLEVVTADGQRLYWGSPPGMEQPNERDARSKLADLISGNFQNGSDLSIATQSPIGHRR